jgi:hypothetical protein
MELQMPTVTIPKVADEVWVATALLHKEHPSALDFSIDQILHRARREALTQNLRPGVYVHIVQHCVANRAPNPGRYRMLFETPEGRRRLFCPGDPYHPDREGAKITPSENDLPEDYIPLIGWYRKWSEDFARRAAHDDPLLRLRGSGQKLWADEPADKYVNRLREGWQ